MSGNPYYNSELALNLLFLFFNFISSMLVCVAFFFSLFYVIFVSVKFLEHLIMVYMTLFYQALEMITAILHRLPQINFGGIEKDTGSSPRKVTITFWLQYRNHF